MKTKPDSDSRTGFFARFAGVLWVVSYALGFAYWPIPELALLGCVLAGFAGLGLLVALGGDLRDRVMRAPRLALAVALFAVLVVGSIFWSVAPYYSLIFSGGFLLLPATILALLVAAPEARSAFLRWSLAGAGLVILGTALWALVQVFVFPEILINGQPRHPFSNPNGFAGLLNLSFFALLGLYFRAEGRKAKILYWCALLIVLSAFAGIAGKAASLAMAVGVAALVIFGDRGVLKSRWKGLALLGGAGFAVATAMALLSDRRGAIDRVYGMVIGGETATIGNRIDIWRASLDLIAANPLQGSGYATFSKLYASVRPVGDYFSSGRMAHMDPLQFWVELGVLGPVLFYAIGIMVLLRFLRFRRGEKAAKAPRDMLVLSLFLGCGAFLAHSHVDCLLYLAPATMAFALAVGALVLRLGGEAEGKAVFAPLGRWPGWVQVLIVIFPFLCFLAAFIPVIGGEYYAGRAARELQRGDLNGFAAAVNRANKIGLGLNTRPYLMAVMIPMDILAATPYLKLEEQQELFRQIDGLLGRALRRNQKLAPAWYQRGRMLRYLSPDIVPAGYPGAEEAFKTALRIDPLYLPARLALADLYEEEGRGEAAWGILLDGVKRPYPDHDAAPYYDRVEALARVLGHDDALDEIAEFATNHDLRVEAARQRRQAEKAVLGGVEDNFPLIP